MERPDSIESDVGRALDAIGGALPAGALGIQLGTGLGGISSILDQATSIPYSEVPGFPSTGAPEHRGILHVGRIEDRALILFEGRVHLYEGVGVPAVTFPIRLLAAVGAQAVLLTCAVGAVNPKYGRGDMVLVRDQLNLTGEDPARAAFRNRPGYPPMDRIYHPVLLERATALAFSLKERYHRGVLAGVRGPSFETPAEVAALAAMGADVVSMSTVLEGMAARTLGLPVLGLAVVTNRAGDPSGVRHDGVVAAAAAASGSVARFVRALCEELDWNSA